MGPRPAGRAATRRAKAVLALHFGVSHEATGFQLELIGRNVRGPQQDAVGAAAERDGD
jgi:hypothetical protein